MSLSSLGKALLKHACPECGHEKEKTAAWFRAIRSYKCEVCERPVVMTYDMKLRLCARYSRKTNSPETSFATEAENHSAE
jgi:hypothetical protein